MLLFCIHERNLVGLEEHRKSEKHQQFANNPKNYEVIDAYIKDGLSWEHAWNMTSSEGELWTSEDDGEATPPPTQEAGAMA